MRIAAIDVGSNSIHMVVAQVESDGRFHVLDRAKEMVRLGQQSLNKGRLSPDAIDAGTRTLAAFRTLAERQGAVRFKAVATSAVREAANGGDFIRNVERKIGLRIRVIPGREEARLVYLGVRHAIDLRGGPSLIVDAGGGSVELVLTEDGRAVSLHSAKLGVSRLSEKYLISDPPSSKELARLESRLAEELDPVFSEIGSRPIRRVIATSGTLLNLISIAGHLRGEPPNGHLNDFRVTPEEISRLRRLLAKSTRAERLRVKGLDGKRIDFIVAGACLADYVLRRLQAKEMVACTWALREGVLLDFISRHRKGIEEIERFGDLRQRSIVRLARHLGHDDKHGQHVAELSLRLFDQLKEELQLKKPARQWLEFAARLHDIGHHIDHKNHHRHSYYLITNAELLGFRRPELEIIGLIARYHRKGAPKDSDPEFGVLGNRDRQVIRAASGILRLADGLDRSRYGVVRDVTVARRGDRLILQLHTEGEDAALEIWEARRRAGLLEQTLGREIDFQIVP